VELNDEDAVRDTVLHEIAHGLAPRHAGHGPTWQRIAASLGARPDRVLDLAAVQLPTPSFVGRCPSCSWEMTAHRRRRVACRRCCVAFNGGRFTADFELAWARAPEFVGVSQ
jgi:predicted SprT family Zn-dependent metalloprotease